MDQKASDLLRAIEDVSVDAGMTPAEKAEAAGRLDRLAGRAALELGRAPSDDSAQVYRRLAMAESWTDRRPLRGLEWLVTAAELATSAELRDSIAEERSRLEDLTVLGDVVPLIRARKVTAARALLRERLEQAGSADERARIQALLDDPRTFAVPVHSAPTMSTINGLGTSLHGRRAARPDGTYVATLYFVVLFIPLLPIAAYVVRKIHPGWQFFAKVPLTRFQIWWRRVAFLAPALLIGTVILAASVAESSWYKEAEAIDAAASSLERNNFAGALAALAPVRGSQDPARSARITELGARAVDAAFDALRDPDDVQLFLTRDARLIHPAWTSDSTADRVERVAMDVARQNGRAAADFLRWARKAIPPFTPRAKAAIEKASDVADDRHLDALALHGTALDRMERRLREGRFDGWDEHALEFIAGAPDERSRPILHLRAERAWKGLEPAGPLAGLRTLPPPLNLLFGLEHEKSVSKKVESLESLWGFQGLPEPHAAWHRLGVARRLSTAYAELNDEDPARWPIDKAKHWALKAYELAPAEVDLRLRAMRLLIDDGDYQKAVSIGESSTGDTRTLVWLGVAYGRSGRPADAARVLRSYVDVNLEAYLKSYEAWNAREESYRTRLYASLSDGTGDRAFIQRLNRLGGEKADLEADRWVREKLAADPTLKKHEAVWRPLQAVYPAALELAMAELALATGDGRQARLREAERLFVQLRRVSSDPHQDLQLAQVYYWLGKPAEGQAIFDGLEKAGDGEVLYKMGGFLRELGRSADARRVLEAAYGKLKGDARHEAALRRSLAWKTLEDRRDWLEKADTSSRYIKAELAQVQGHLALREGRYPEAARSLKEAAAYHASLDDGEKSFNNAALLEWDIARATGETARLAVARTLLRKAVDKEPQDGIVLNNYVDGLIYIAYGALSGDILSVGTLHALPSVNWLDWRAPTLPAEGWASAARAQAEFRQAAELGSRARVLSPDHRSGVYSQLYFARLTRDAAAVRALRTSIEEGAAVRPPQVDSPEDPKASKQAPAPDGPFWAPRVEAARKAGAPPATLAYLLHRLAAESFDADPAASLKLADEARALHDCPATRRYLMTLRLSSAARAWADRDPAFKAWQSDDLSDPADLSTYFHKHPGKRDEFRATEEVKLVRAAAEEAAAMPSPIANFGTWRTLRLAGSPKEAELKAAIVADTIQLDVLLIDLTLDGDPIDVVDAWESATLYGDGPLAERVAADARRRKLLPALFTP